MGCSVGFKYAKNALAAGAPPWTVDPTGRTHAPTDFLLRGGRKGWYQARNQGARGHASQTMDKKLKLSCRVTHIDVLTVAVTNYHKTATAHK